MINVTITNKETQDSRQQHLSQGKKPVLSDALCWKPDGGIICPCNSAGLLQKYCESILNIASDGIYITDNKGKTLFVNSMYERLTGLKKADLYGRNVRALVKEGVFDHVLNPEVVQTKKPALCAQTVRGEKKIILRACPVFDEKSEVCLVVTFARDITMLTQFREQLAHQKALIDDFHERLESNIYAAPNTSQPIFVSPRMLDVLARLKRVAATDATILLLGETGVGKDVLARLAHEHSPRSQHVFLKIDCGSIAPNLIESELFGYMPGAFSGANTRGKAGYFEIANGGTIFLDEIGELPLPMQTKLLRVLQDKEVIRVGAAKARRIDIRIIAATNRDLANDVRTGKFRKDLFYRLNVAVLNIPPLRERHEDILPLAQFFLERFSLKYKRSMKITPGALDVLANYIWPGNVREMQNVIQSIIVTSEKASITRADLPPQLTGINGPSWDYSIPDMGKVQPLHDVVDKIEREILTSALEQYGSVNKVAKMFQISRTTVFRKLRK